MTESNLTAIVGATLIDGNGGRPVQDGVILVEGERILAIGGRDVAVPAGAKHIAAEGKYIIPGLMDANVHLVVDYWPLTLVRYAGRYDELAIEAAQLALKFGVTTVFDTWGPRRYLIKAREAVNAGEVVAARIFVGGNIVGLGGPFSADFLPAGTMLEEFTSEINSIWQENVGPELVWMSPSQVRGEIQQYVKSGIDFLKFAVTTHRGEQQHFMFSPRVQHVIVDEAHRAGLTVQTHTTTNEALEFGIQLEVDLMQHLDLTFGPQAIPGETVDRLVESKMPGGLLPQTNRALDWYRENAERTPMLKRYEIMERNARALLSAGANVLLTTDAGVFSTNTLNSSDWKSWQLTEESLLIMGEGHFHWLQAVEQKGMDPMKALMAATRNIAEAYNVDRDLGTLEIGKIADLVILDKDPLERASNYRAIHSVMKAGRFVDCGALPTVKHLTGAATLPWSASGVGYANARWPCSISGKHG